MLNLGLIGGTNLANTKLFSSFTKKIIKTQWGEVQVCQNKNITFLQRHGDTHDIPPHKINHLANIAALKNANCDIIIAFCSVGSLKNNIPIGTLFFPNDFFSPYFCPTYFDNKCIHTIPTISENLIRLLCDIANETNIPYLKNGVYNHSLGPRFETKSEVRYLSSIADVTGMTAGAEIPLANELHIPFALVCMVDNYANGIGKELTIEEVLKQVNKNLIKVEYFVEKLINYDYSKFIKG